MTRIRDFSAQSAGAPESRNIEDASEGMRQELIDLFFFIAEHRSDEVPPEHIYNVTYQCLGLRPPGIPDRTYRHAVGRAILKPDWPRIYDLIARLWPDFDRHGLGRDFREGTNRILAGYQVAWELGDDGRLARVLPKAARVQVNDAFAELNDARYEPALELFKAGRDAFDARPRRDRDACSNVFDALESVAKEKFRMPDATYGQVVAQLRADETFNFQILGMLQSLNELRNRNFGHGMITSFSLTRAEVDFAYLACVSAILLFVRTP